MLSVALPRSMYPPTRRMTCHQLAEHMLAVAGREHWGDASRRQIRLVANRVARATKHADQLSALDDACALSRVGTHHSDLVTIRRLAARAAKAIEARCED